MTAEVIRSVGPARPFALPKSVFVPRHEFLALLLLLGFGSAVTERVLGTASQGLAAAVASTFDISAVVWGACWVGTSFFFDASKIEAVRRSDLIAGFAFLLIFLAPFSLVNWVGLTGLALYVAATSERRSLTQRGAFIFIALTVPMFWSPRLFNLFSDHILAADAVLVSWIVGTERIGNTVPFLDREGFLYIAPGCSSMANISLAVLCWAVFGQLSDRAASRRDIAWCLLLCGSVVALNVLRISLIGVYPDWYEALHGPTGALVASYVSLFTMVGLCAIWKKRELFPRT